MFVQRFGRSLLAALLLATTLVVGLPSVSEAAVVRPFTTRFTMNTTGAITMTGNTLLTCPPAASGCLAARTGTAPTDAANNDNAYSMIFVDVDADTTTFNSSRNTLTIPGASTVAWAGLYWGADTSAGTGGTAAATPASRNTVLFKTPGASTYTPITATQVDLTGTQYQGFADVTALVQSARSGEYSTANLQAGRGADRYGGWSLVVAYQDPNEPLRNLTVFDGYAVVRQNPVADQNVAIPVSGFLTPPTGTVRTRVGVVAYEGDLGLKGDSLRLNSTSLTNGLNPATNFFNSSLTGFGSTNTTGDPFQTNMLGFDIDTIGADGILANGATSATLNLNTTNDTYYPGVVSFSTELFAPEIRLEKSAVDLNGGTLDVGDEILYTVRSTNAGQDAAKGVVATDEIPVGTTFVPGSLLVEGVAVTDAPNDDVGEVAAGPARIVARLGTGANANAGGLMPIADVREFSFRVTVEAVDPDQVIANTADADYVGSTSNLPLSVVSNTVVLTPRPLADLLITKTGPTLPVLVPGAFSYDLTVVNRGPSVEPAAVVTDTLPANFVASSTTGPGSCTLGATVTCSVGTLGVGATASIRITGTVATGSGTINNTATVDGANLDRFPSNNTASASVALNNAPSAVPQAATTPPATPVVIPVLTGSADPDSDPVSTFAAGPATNGSVVVNADGTVTYTPNPGFKGVDTFTYTVTDGLGGFATSTVTVTVANGLPVATDDSVATAPATPVIIPVLANDSDPNGDVLTITGVTAPTGGIGATGIVVDNGDGTVTFTPDPTFSGTATFTYTISDGTDTATATVTVLVPNAGPVAVDDATTTPADTSVVVPVVANDLDDNGQPLTISAVGAATNGTAVDSGGGNITYTPNPGFKGDDTFTYTITDGAATATATVTITVLNAPPAADDVIASTTPGTTVDIPVLTAASDPNADPLIVIAVSTPTNGTATLNPDGTVSYTPNPGFKGDDTFTYTVTDGTDTATATVTVTVANDPPVAAADRRQTTPDTPVVVPVLLNDVDPNGDALSIVATTPPANGTIVVDADGTITYTPSPGYKGIDTFTYTITDGTDTATATVTITVLNAPPLANDDVATTVTDTPVVIAPIDNDTDSNDDPLSIVATTPPDNGTIVVNDDGTVTYTPDTEFTGDDTFTYTVSDGSATSTATVTVTVTAVDVIEPPTTVSPTTVSPTTTPPSVPATTTAPVDVPLPTTGSESRGLLAAALFSLVLGGGLILLARRRSSPAT